jgi:hypothetical protein
MLVSLETAMLDMGAGIGLETQMVGDQTFPIPSQPW